MFRWDRGGEGGWKEVLESYYMGGWVKGEENRYVQGKDGVQDLDGVLLEDHISEEVFRSGGRSSALLAHHFTVVCSG